MKELSIIIYIYIIMNNIDFQKCINLKYRDIIGVIIYSSFFDNSISILLKSSINCFGVLYILHDIEEKFIFPDIFGMKIFSSVSYSFFPNINFIEFNSDLIEELIKSLGDFSVLQEVIFLLVSFKGTIDLICKISFELDLNVNFS